MQHKCQFSMICIIALVSNLFFSCSGKNIVSRGSGAANSNISSSSENSEQTTGNHPNDNDSNPPGYETGAVPVPITGANLVEVLVSAYCVEALGGIGQCRKVRFGAEFKVNKGEAVRFTEDTAAAFGIGSSNWEIVPPAGVTCLKSTGGYLYNPLCSSDDSLTNKTFQASLEFAGADGQTFKNNVSDVVPILGVVYGNFMLLEASAGLTPANLPSGSLASSEFSQIWAVLKGNESYLESIKQVSYVTNILYNGENFTSGPNWNQSNSLCASVNSGDGLGRWHLPSAKEQCGTNFEQFLCNGGLNLHEIGKVPFAGGVWDGRSFWTSTSVSGPDMFALGANFKIGEINRHNIVGRGNGVFCVR